jgi:hypothetical protein
MKFTPVSDAERAKALSRHKAGESISAIAESLKIKPDRVRYILQVAKGQKGAKSAKGAKPKVMVLDDKPAISPKLEKLLAHVRQRMKREHVDELTIGADGRCTLRFHHSVTVDV